MAAIRKTSAVPYKRVKGTGDHTDHIDNMNSSNAPTKGAANPGPTVGRDLLSRVGVNE